MTTDQKLDDIIARLERIESRQIHTTGMVQEMEKAEQAQTVGSFASVQSSDR